MTPRIDASTHSLQTIDYPHHEIHGGSAFHCVEVVDLGNSEVRDIQVTTPNNTKWAHMTFALSSESETQFLVYENATINLTGGECLTLNQNRNSTNSSGLTVRAIDNTNVSNANADTGITGSTLIYSGIMGAGKDAGDHTHEHEFILKQNEDYSWRFIANSAGFVNYKFEWYEHTSKS